MRLLNFIGATIAVIGMVFVGHRLFLHADEIRLLQLTKADIATLGAASVFSGTLGILLTFSWRKIVAHFGGALTRRQAFHIYGISQIGKYIPGNIFHFAGRQAMGQQAGVPAGAMFKSAIWEIGLFSVVGALFAPLALPGYLHWPIWTGIGLFAIGVIAVVAAIKAVLDNDILFAATYYFAYLLGFSAVFLIALSVLTDMPLGSIPILIGAYVISWLAGLLTPGAPAGIGVRELVLYTMLIGTFDQSIIAPTVLLGRAVNVVGDVLFFLAALLTRNK